MEFLGYTLERDLPNGNYLKEEFLAGVIQQVPGAGLGCRDGKDTNNDSMIFPGPGTGS